MAQKSHSNFYAAVTVNLATIVGSWPEAKALTSGQKMGKTRGAKTFKEAEDHLRKLVDDRNKLINFHRYR
ncbi:hypothetical protein IHC87_06885 [Photobacterium damselae subsp. damselae]|uniref:hypothetical protein n=1 Tax=Photobacterium damselae TaxID=38293 RepID=UPI001F414188|nr:hypothetical protein [Photobacterium damselae]UJZ95065.1 hypothetical protein IHC87_06885 [Photobacterium damselae subsp. damselae]UJZ99046.1 hypothetical protein IHC88_06875 [Photobacterium damselae subsp. damselae]